MFTRRLGANLLQQRIYGGDLPVDRLITYEEVELSAYRTLMLLWIRFLHLVPHFFIFIFFSLQIHAYLRSSTSLPPARPPTPPPFRVPSSISLPAIFRVMSRSIVSSSPASLTYFFSTLFLVTCVLYDRIFCCFLI